MNKNQSIKEKLTHDQAEQQLLNLTTQLVNQLGDGEEVRTNMVASLTSIICYLCAHSGPSTRQAARITLVRASGLVQTVQPDMFKGEAIVTQGEVVHEARLLGEQKDGCENSGQ